MPDIASVHNTSRSQFARRHSELVRADVDNSLKKLSSGYRINRAADDAASLAVSEKLRTQVRGLQQATRNVQEDASMIQTADAATQSIQEILQRMRELAVQASNGIYSDSDRALLQLEISELLSEQDRIATSTTWHGFKLLSTNKVDVVLAVDSTGSMAAEIAQAASVLTSFSNTLAESGISLQMGIVEYRDITDGSTGGTGIQSVTNLTSDINSIVSRMNAISGAVGGGGDLPESGLEALNRARQMNFRGSSQKYALLVTDADIHDAVDGGPNPPEPEDALSNLEMSSVISNLVTNGIQVDAIDAAGANGVATGYIAAQTGGSSTDITGGVAGMSSFLTTLAARIIAKSGKVVTVQDGANKNQKFDSIQPGEARSRVLGNSGIDISTQAGAESAIAMLDGAIEDFMGTRANFAAEMSKVEFKMGFNRAVNERMTQAESRIRDTDMALEITSFSKSQIIAQSSQAMLAQANLIPQNILSLLS